MVRMTTILDAKLAIKDLLKPLSALLAYLKSISKRDYDNERYAYPVVKESGPLLKKLALEYKSLPLLRYFQHLKMKH